MYRIKLESPWLLLQCTQVDTSSIIYKDASFMEYAFRTCIRSFTCLFIFILFVITLFVINTVASWLVVFFFLYNHSTVTSGWEICFLIIVLESNGISLKLHLSTYFYVNFFQIYIGAFYIIKRQNWKRRMKSR